ncbi:acetate/propionate family kinase [Burkholderia multivorans]|uniref:acetate/propionate family kinase n=1 Tax=Burkholderia ubonensis TaxID=101571 RepID=UPI000F7099D6|nr:acetate/propionate family kinase [Burkholderia ubonensis]AYZ62611.1 acetate/propionate family kinase [Burkholderia multivorans]VWC13522.1 acetate kinase [Burkholderia ubonensis]
MKHPVLVLNAGSSSLKFSVYDTLEDRSLGAGVHGQVDSLHDAPHLVVKDARGATLADHPVAGTGHHGAIEALHAWFARHVGDDAAFDGVGHRVVHGGRYFSAPVRIDDDVLAKIASLSPLAPLHQPHHVEAIRAVSALAPDLPQVACFDTAFHHTLPALEREFALPRALTEQGIMRYGFHGLSYEYIATALAALDASWAQRRTIVAHLGNGASLCALAEGRSVATTMGFTAVDGLPMGTRTGTLDPGAILYLLRHEGRTIDEVEHLIYEESGLLGVSGLSSDMRTLLASDSAAAAHAVDLFAYRAARELAALAGVLGGLDTLVFTAGIGENAPAVRERICRAAGWLGIELDAAANAGNRPVISGGASRVTVRVIPTDENLMIARHTRGLLDRLSI